MDDQDNGSNKPTKSYGKGYGKRPLWQWLVIYLVVAVIVYGIIYILFFNHTGSTPNAPLY